MFNSLQIHGLQHASFPCLSPSLTAYSNSCPLSWWCYPTILSSVFPFSSCLQSFPQSGSFQMSQFFASVGQSIGVSASTSDLPMNIQGWSPSEWTGWISLQSKGLSRVPSYRAPQSLLHPVVNIFHLLESLVLQNSPKILLCIFLEANQDQTLSQGCTLFFLNWAYFVSAFSPFPN